MSGFDPRRAGWPIGGNLISRSAPGTTAHSFSDQASSGPPAQSARVASVRHSSPENRAISRSLDESQNANMHHNSSPAALPDFRRALSSQVTQTRIAPRRTSTLNQTVAPDSLSPKSPWMDKQWTIPVALSTTAVSTTSLGTGGFPWPNNNNIWHNDARVHRHHSDAIPSPTTILPGASGGSNYFAPDGLASNQASRRSSNAVQKPIEPPQTSNQSKIRAQSDTLSGMRRISASSGLLGPTASIGSALQSKSMPTSNAIRPMSTKNDSTKEPSLDTVPEHPSPPAPEILTQPAPPPRVSTQVAAEHEAWSNRPRAETEPKAEKALMSPDYESPRPKHSSHGDITYISNRTTLGEELSLGSIFSNPPGLTNPLVMPTAPGATTTIIQTVLPPKKALSVPAQQKVSITQYTLEKSQSDPAPAVQSEALRSALMSAAQSISSEPLNSGAQPQAALSGKDNQLISPSAGPRLDSGLVTSSRSHPYGVSSPLPKVEQPERPTFVSPDRGAAIRHSPGPFILVRFKGFRHDVFEIPPSLKQLDLKSPDYVVVEGDRGADFGQITNGPFSFPDAQACKVKYDETWTHSMQNLVEEQASGYQADASYNRNGPPRANPHQSPKVQDPPGDLYQPTSGNLNSLSPPSKLQIHGPRLNVRSDRVPKVIRDAQPSEVATYLYDKPPDDEAALVLVQSKAAELGFDMNVLDAEWQWDRAVLTCHYWSDAYIDYNSLVPELYKILKRRLKLWNLNPRAQRPAPRRRRFDRVPQYDSEYRAANQPAPRPHRRNTGLPGAYQNPNQYGPRQHRANMSANLQLNDMNQLMQPYHSSSMTPISQSLLSPSSFIYPPNLTSPLLSPSMGINPYIAMAAAAQMSNFAYAANILAQSRSPGEAALLEQLGYGQPTPTALGQLRQLEELGAGRVYSGRAHEMENPQWTADNR